MSRVIKFYIAKVNDNRFTVYEFVIFFSGQVYENVRLRTNFI